MGNDEELDSLDGVGGQDEDYDPDLEAESEYAQSGDEDWGSGNEDGSESIASDDWSSEDEDDWGVDDDLAAESDVEVEDSKGTGEESQSRIARDPNSYEVDSPYTDDTPLEDPSAPREGVSGTVTQYTYTDVELPYFLIKDVSSLMLSYKLDLVKKLMKPIPGINQTINVYLMTQTGDWYYLGKMAPAQVKTFFQVVGLESVEARIASPNQPEGRLLTGHLLYTLSD